MRCLQSRLSAILLALATSILQGQTTPIPWDLTKLDPAPAHRWLSQDVPVHSLLYSGETYQDKPTEVFAFYASPATLSGTKPPAGGFPAVVLIHGGGGTAFAEWTHLWAKRGYAAISARKLLLRRPGRVGPGRGVETGCEGVWQYPQVVYSAGPSPWCCAMPWGDVTTVSNTLNLVVFDWPADGRLSLPGLQTEIAAAGVVVGGKLQPVKWAPRGTWTELQLPAAPPDRPASVVAVKLKATPNVDQTLGIHPNATSTLLVEFAEVSGAEKKGIRWMEKFGEWKFANQVSKWSDAGKAVWTVDVCEAGDYRLELTYKGEGRLAWRIETDEGVKLQNQQNSSPVYHTYPFGLLTFNKSGKHTIAVSLVDGDRNKASLECLRISPAE